MSLDGKTALVTGAGRRVGRAIALELARRGVHLALHCRTSVKETRALAALLKRDHEVDADVFVADLAKPAEAERMAKAALKRFKRIDILINNASIFERTPVGKVTVRDFERHLAINLTSPFMLAQALAPGMARHGGHIVNIADWSAKRPWADYAPYCASKAGLLAINESLAKALAPNVQVNAVMPGPVLVPDGATQKFKRDLAAKTLLKRLGSPDEAARAVLFFLESDFATGAAVAVDGGRLIL